MAWVDPGQSGGPPVQQQPGQEFYPLGPAGGQQPPPYGGAPPPITEQPPPAYGGMMPPPAGHLVPDNVPPGLEYLVQVDQLLVKQKFELLEALCGCEGKNKYKIKNSMGQQVFYAKEDTNCCTRNCCGPTRPFDMIITDNNEREVLHLSRPLRCQSCLFPCFLQELEVSDSNGVVIGRVEQEWSICAPKFAIYDQSNQLVLRMKGPVCTFSICGDVEFDIVSPDESMEVGKISKQWSGLAREAFTDSDNFGISFPMDLDCRMKATLIGAMFLIDFMFFEKAGNKEEDGVGML